MSRPKGIPAWNKGMKLPDEWRKNLSLSHIGKQPWLGKKHLEETKLKMSLKKIEYFSNNKQWNYMEDRTQLAVKQQRNDMAYQEWRKSIWSRDNFKCKINNQDCDGRIEAHHILNWRDHPELRYEINNGITLCHAHHPRKRAEEKRLIPTFRELVPVSKE